MNGNKLILIPFCRSSEDFEKKNNYFDKFTEIFPQYEILKLDLSEQVSSDVRQSSEILKEVISFCDKPPHEFDAAIRASHLLQYKIPVSVFFIDKQCFENRIYRNLFLLAADSSQLKTNVLCVPIGFGVTHNELLDSFKRDEHLYHSLKRIHFTSSAVPDVYATISEINKWLQEIDSFDTFEKQNGRISLFLRKIIHTIVIVNWWIMPFSIVFGIVVVVSFAIGKKVDSNTINIMSSLLGYILGFSLSTVPACPAFTTLKINKILKKHKAVRFNIMVSLPAVLLLYIHFFYGTNLFTLLFIAIGLILSLFEEKWRSLSNTLYLKLQGMENYFENLLERSTRYFPFLKDKTASQIWTWYAARFTSCRRDPLFTKPYVFISYTWHLNADKETAKGMAKILKDKGIKYFLDVDEPIQYPFWRTRIAEQLMSVSHMIFIASEESMSKAKTCADEIKQALSALHLTSKPTLAVYFAKSLNDSIKINTAEQIKFLIDNALIIDDGIIENPQQLCKWIYRTLPNTWFKDLLSNAYGLIRAFLLVIISIGFLLWAIWRLKFPVSGSLPVWFYIGVILIAIISFFKVLSGNAPQILFSIMENGSENNSTKSVS
jgi:hypothetical protein